MTHPSIFRMPHCLKLLLSAAVAWSASGAVWALAPAPPADLIIVPDQAQPIMPLDQVRVGMRGYGLTVFHGSAIEPFEVEVVSVQRDFGPQRGVIWVRCPDARMQHTGPVSGMSGSPVYLWNDATPEEQRQAGQGGLLIGAFAFGYNLSKDCYVGIQPIEYMRATGRRTQDVAADADEHTPVRGAGEVIARQLRNLLAAAQAAGEEIPAQALAIARLRDPDSLSEIVPPNVAPAPSVSNEGGLQPAAMLRPLALPMAIPGPAGDERSRWLTALLEPLGLAPLSGGGSATGLNQAAAIGAPSNVALDAIRIEPGSVLSVPLGWGDMELAAAGTVTDVLPDGTVLGFGHAFQGVGPAAMPMATGFVHFIQPSINTSFKLSGSGRIAGALTRDEPSAVAGRAAAAFETAPMTVTVALPDREVRTYNYTVVRDRTYMPTIVTVLAMLSTEAEQKLPPDHTLRITGRIDLPGDRALTIASTTARGGTFQVIMNLFPALGTLASNDFEPLLPRAVELRIEVVERVQSLQLIRAAATPRIVAPGEQVTLTVRMQPYREAAYDRTLRVRIPEHMPDGDYELAVSGPGGYLGRLMATRPHLAASGNLDELLQSLQVMTRIPQQAMFVTLVGNVQGVAVGRQELPALPSSRAALIAAPSHTLAAPYAVMHTLVVPSDGLPVGNLRFNLTVRSQPEPMR